MTETPQPPGAPARIAAMLEIGDIKAGRNELSEQDITDLHEVLRQLADYEGRITWNTTCGQCATVLDRAIADYERAEKAEAQRDQARRIVRALMAPLGRVTVHKALADSVGLDALPNWLTEDTTEATG